MQAVSGVADATELGGRETFAAEETLDRRQDRGCDRTTPWRVEVRGARKSLSIAAGAPGSTTAANGDFSFDHAAKEAALRGAIEARHDERGKSLLELTNECCRWPMADRRSGDEVVSLLR
jgi:hypothetical protein